MNMGSGASSQSNNDVTSNPSNNRRSMVEVVPQSKNATNNSGRRDSKITGGGERAGGSTIIRSGERSGGGGGGRSSRGRSNAGGNSEEEIVFETFHHKSGKTYSCIFTNGCRFYLDNYQSSNWKEFPWEWYSEGSLVTDDVQQEIPDNFLPENYVCSAEELPTSSDVGEVSVTMNTQTQAAQSDDREGVLKVPGKGNFHTYVFEHRRNVHCYYDPDEGSWIKIPVRWELTTALGKELVRRVQTATPQWHDEVDIIAALRVSNYNVDDCVNTYLATTGKEPARLSREKSVIAESNSFEAVEKKLRFAEAKIKDLETKLSSETRDKEYLQKKFDDISQQMVDTRAECQAALAQIAALKETRPKTAPSKRAGLEPVSRDALNKVQANSRELLKSHLQARGDMKELSSKFANDLKTLMEMMKKLKSCEQSSQSEVEELRKLYRREALQRKLLYNQLQELRGNIRVFARCRKDPSVQNTITCPQGMDMQLAVGTTKKTFSFDKAFDPSATQETVFADVLPIITSCADGYNICILAYGQTGSGKTFTMQGPKDNPGVNVRAIKELLRICDQRKENIDYKLELSMVEIYNEAIQDLLSDGVKGVEIRSNGNKIELPGLTTKPVQSEADISSIMDTGAANRKVASTKMNSESSRSHLLVMLVVRGTDRMSNTVSRGQLTMCDLAGSERVSKTEASGARLTEAAFINKSLTSLGQVFTALRTNQLHVPYRNSKLTHILQPSLGGDSKACVFVNISPDPNNLQESLSTLQFGANARQVALGQAKANVTKK